MAKDGTMRGNTKGNTHRAGRGVQKTLLQKIDDGTVKDLPNPAQFEGVETPPPEDYMAEKQHGDIALRASELHQKTCKWLIERGVLQFIEPQLVNTYAMNLARWIQCEQFINKHGFLSKHPTTGSATRSPFQQMSIEYQRQAIITWGQIYAVVQEKCSTPWSGPTPQDDVMEKLLSE